MTNKSIKNYIDEIHSKPPKKIISLTKQRLNIMMMSGI